ncbi:MAG: FimV/HubP family polar landmark protein [Comamonas sp.]
MQRWKLSALAAATLAFSGLTSSNAWALALGRITVQSALGEPLRAEVEIPQLTSAEADNLQASIASPAAFRSQGVEYSGIASSVRIKVQKRANGTAVLQLSSFQPVNDPFIDLVIDANWTSGNLQRSYTLLLDPPAARRPAPVVTAAAQTSAPEVAPRPRPIPPLAAERPIERAAASSLRNKRGSEENTPRKRAAETASPAAPASGEKSIKIKPGDTASRLAARYRPAGVSLDQMLVAMLRSNPQAFVNDNVNQMRSGAVIEMPDAGAAKATSPREARQILAAQSRDFNEFRRLLAGAAPAVPVEAASRTASGQVQAQVQDAKPGTAAPDKLTLSKGAVKAVAEDEKLAQQKQSADQSNRVDELKRNIAELNQIAAASKPDGVPATGAVADPAAPTTAATEGTKPAVAQDPSATAATGNVAPAGNAAATDGSAPTATPAPKPAPVAAPAPAPAEPGFIDNLLADPTIPLAGAAILALLLGYGGYRVAQRRKAAAVTGDSTLIDSRLDSFFGSSGGQRVDTGISSQMSGHSMHYSPSQLDAGDVDPLAEADVYLAYGRDLQAEEILKEALRSTPNRLALHQKLGEIYAKRHDRLSFEATANHVYALTQGQGVEWQRLSDQGRILDPDNALYQPGGSPQPRSAASAQAFMPSQFSATEPASTQMGRVAAATAVTAAGAAGLAAAHQTRQSGYQPPHDDREGPATLPLDMDLGMDLDLPGGLADASLSSQPMPMEAHIPQPSAQDFDALEFSDSQPAAQPPVASLPTPAAPTADNSLNMDFSAMEAFTPPTAPADNSQAFAATSLDALEFDLDSFTLPQTAPAAETRAPGLTEERATEQQPLEPAKDPVANSHIMDFDLGGLSLDLGNGPASSPALTAVAAAPTAPEDPLATKLALAEEFNAIGDADGARTLIEEVIAEAHGDLKTKAQSLLSQIG